MTRSPDGTADSAPPTHAKRTIVVAEWPEPTDSDRLTAMPENISRASAKLACPFCGAAAAIDVQRKTCANDEGGTRTYIASCSSCGPVAITRQPDYAGDAYCTHCAGALSWSCDLDTAADRNAYPLYCAQCGRVANAGVRFPSKKQRRLLEKLHKLDTTYDALWLRAGTVPEQNQKYHGAATARAGYLTRKRRRIVGRLEASAKGNPVEIIKADQLRLASRG
jgi:transcription elongation factor Elf1